MSISTQLTYLARNVGNLTADTNAIFEALRAKGVNVPANAQLSDVADLIESINPPHQNEVEIGGIWYPYVKIGNQLWLAENLDYKFNYNGSTLPIGGTSFSYYSPHAWYYDNDETNYGIEGTYKCGLSYNWYAVKYLNDNRGTLLPEGWHVPSIEELNTLKSTLGSNPGTKLKVLNNSVTSNWPSNWNGTNDYEFNAIPSGEIRNGFSSIDRYAYYWSTTEFGSDNATRKYLDNSSIFDDVVNSKIYGSSLRLVKDAT